MITDGELSAFPIGGNNNHGEWVIEGGISIREYACIKLKVPETGNEWLDDLILKSLITDIAAKAMHGILCGKGFLDSSQDYRDYVSKNAYAIADAMIAAGKGE